MILDDPRAWGHPPHCECDHCAHYYPAVPPALTWADLARYGCVGLLAGAGTAALAPDRAAASIGALLGIG